MKNIFKKNQIIIMALAIMIAIAGYLNFSDRGGKDTLETNSTDVLDYDTTSEETMNDDITQSDVFSDELLDETVLDLPSNEDANGETASDEEKTDTAKEEGNPDDVALVDVSDTGEVKSDTKAVDTKDTDKKDTAKEDTAKKDADKKDTETSTPGEAVLVSTTTSIDFFQKNRLKREQDRAKQITNLLAIIDSENLTEAAKEKAVDEMLDMNTIADKEDSTEVLLEAKGFSDPLVRITGEDVEVVVNAASLTEQEVAQITDIVTRKTGMDVKNIVIAPVVATE